MTDSFTYPTPTIETRVAQAKTRTDSLVAEMKALPEVKSVSDDALYAIAVMFEGRTADAAVIDRLRYDRSGGKVGPAPHPGAVHPVTGQPFTGQPGVVGGPGGHGPMVDHTQPQSAQPQNPTTGGPAAPSGTPRGQPFP